MGQVLSTLPLPFKKLKELDSQEQKQLNEMLFKEINELNEEGVSFIFHDENILYNTGNIVIMMSYTEFEKKLKIQSVSDFVLTKIKIKSKTFIVYHSVNSIIKTKYLDDVLVAPDTIFLVGNNAHHCC